MRDCKKNSRKLWYSNLLENEPVLDENGDETGDTKPVYGTPIPFMASVSPERVTPMRMCLERIWTIHVRFPQLRNFPSRKNH